jgi:hypothetical protein
MFSGRFGCSEHEEGLTIPFTAAYLEGKGSGSTAIVGNGTAGCMCFAANRAGDVKNNRGALRRIRHATVKRHFLSGGMTVYFLACGGVPAARKKAVAIRFG